MLRILIILTSLCVVTNSIAAPKTKKNPDTMTLDDWDQEARQIEVKEPKAGDEEHGKGTTHGGRAVKKFSSHTELDLGVGLTSGSWPADRSNTTVLMASVQQMLIPDPVYVTLGLNSFLSPATPRNFLLAAALGGGVIHSRNIVAPFAGFRTGVARVVASGRGRGFGFMLGPEIGFFPFRISNHPISLRVQYSWMTARIGGYQPSWFGLTLGFVF